MNYNQLEFAIADDEEMALSSVPVAPLFTHTSTSTHIFHLPPDNQVHSSDVRQRMKVLLNDTTQSDQVKRAHDFAHTRHTLESFTHSLMSQTTNEYRHT